MRSYVKIIAIISLLHSISAMALTMNKACLAIANAGGIEVAQEWQENQSCVSKSEAITNIVSYILKCGLELKPLSFGASWDKKNKLGRLFQFDILYGRSFLKSDSFQIDLNNDLTTLFSDQIYKRYNNTGKILLHHSDSSGGSSEYFVAVTCSGRIHEYEIFQDNF